MEVVRIRSVQSLIDRLTRLAVPAYQSNYVFRGHSRESWKLTTTYNRYSTSQLYEHRAIAFQALIAHFENSLCSLGENPMASMTLRGKLEFSRHNGIPSPLIDFSYSPLVALWFAFNGVKGSVQSESLSVYALNITNLGFGISQVLRSIGLDEEYFRNLYERDLFSIFRWEQPDFFDSGFPLQMLKFVPLAASWNTKMQRQRGCFLYDNLVYEAFNCACLEDLICENPEMQRVDNNNPILTKYIIPSRLASEAFDILDLHGINGTHLYNDVTGAVCDTHNTFNYNPRSISWDLNVENGDH